MFDLMDQKTYDAIQFGILGCMVIAALLSLVIK
jgi:hypothetical protein